MEFEGLGGPSVLGRREAQSYGAADTVLSHVEHPTDITLIPTFLLWCPQHNVSLSTVKQLGFMWGNSTYQPREVEPNPLPFLKKLFLREK